MRESVLSDIPSSKPWSFEMIKIVLKLRCCEYDILKGSFLGAQKLESRILYSEEMKSGLAPTSASDEALSLQIHKVLILSKILIPFQQNKTSDDSARLRGVN